MPYTPTTWVDGATKLGPINLNKLEQGLVASAATADAAAARVPATIAPLVEGKWLKASGGAMIWDSPVIADVTGLQTALDAKQPKVTYSATPPGSPADGDEWVLPADATGGVMWRFRYRAASASAYKWEFVGGNSLYALVAAVESTTTVGAWLDLTTVGPRVTVPRAGDYDVVVSSAKTLHTATAAVVYIGVAINAATPFIQTLMQPPLANVQAAFSALAGRAVGCAAGDELRMRYHNATAGTASWVDRWLRIQPVRVS